MACKELPLCRNQVKGIQQGPAPLTAKVCCALVSACLLLLAFALPSRAQQPAAQVVTNSAADGAHQQPARALDHMLTVCEFEKSGWFSSVGGSSKQHWR